MELIRNSYLKQKQGSLATLMQEGVLSRDLYDSPPKMLDVSTSVKLLKDFERYEQNLLVKM